MRQKAQGLRFPARASSGPRGSFPALHWDIASEAGLLLGGDRLVRQDRIDGGSEVAAIVGSAVAGAAVVELSAID